MAKDQKYLKNFFRSLSKEQLTTHCILREYENIDYKEYSEIFFQDKVMEAFGAKPFSSLEQFDDFLVFNKKYRKNLIGFNYLIFSKERNDVLGEIGVKFEDIKENIVELSYVLKYEYWKHGIMTECANKLIDVIYEIDPDIIIQSQCRVDNLGSQKLLKKCGFKFLGLEDIETYPQKRYEHIKNN